MVDVSWGWATPKRPRDLIPAAKCNFNKQQYFVSFSNKFKELLSNLKVILLWTDPISNYQYSCSFLDSVKFSLEVFPFEENEGNTQEVKQVYYETYFQILENPRGEILILGRCHRKKAGLFSRFWFFHHFIVSSWQI